MPQIHLHLHGDITPLLQSWEPARVQSCPTVTELGVSKPLVVSQGRSAPSLDFHCHPVSRWILGNEIRTENVTLAILEPHLSGDIRVARGLKPLQCGTFSHRAMRDPSNGTFSGVVNQNWRGPGKYIVRVQARLPLPASLLVSGRFDSRRMFVLVRWSLLVLPSLLPSVVYTVWGIPEIPNACQAALSCGVRLMVRSAPRA